MLTIALIALGSTNDIAAASLSLGAERIGVPVDVSLRDDLMTGYHFQCAKRYSISLLDIAIMKDCGILTKN